MAKKHTVYFCKECGHESNGWLGKCPGCQSWNSFVEAEKVTGKKKNEAQPSRGGWMSDNWDVSGDGAAARPGETGQVQRLSEITSEKAQRVSLGIGELDRVLGGGLVLGSIVLLGGDPGIGKSTLVLQILGNLPEGSSLYVSGEESPSQIKMRADRLGVLSEKVAFLGSTSFSDIVAAVKREKPRFLVIDSIQTIYVEEQASAPGSVTQLREVTAGFLRLSKALGIAVILIGHVTKEGNIAGPRVIEHMVDTVLYFEGESMGQHRILRAVKNRFGATDELGFFSMGEKGLVGIDNIAGFLLEGRPMGVPGSVVTSVLEGTRPILLEVQVLLSTSSFASPLRMTQGLDRMRLSMLLAVTEKKMRLGLSALDAYVNITGGVKVKSTSADLAVICAAVSSVKEVTPALEAVVLGEVGLTGEVRAIQQIGRRIAEAERAGWQSFIVPAGNKKDLEQAKLAADTKLYYVSEINETFDLLFG